MIGLRDLSVRSKLLLIIVGVSSGVVLTGLLVVFLNHITSSREDLKSDAALHAELVGQYCVVPLTFEYEDEARQVLGKLACGRNSVGIPLSG